jgi:hypothetical protein
MRHLTTLTAALVLSGLTLPAAALTPLDRHGPSSGIADQLARGGARGGGGAAARPQTGFASAGSGLNRGTSRPSGGWSSRVPTDRATPSLNRGGVAQRNGGFAGGTNRDFNRDVNRNVNRDVSRNVNRDVNRNITRNWGGNVNLAGVNLYPGWARPGWAVARPWSYGWYGGWARPAWGWWGARAAAWGITTLATASVINAAVNSAVQNQVSYIVVPETDLQLLYGTVQPSGSNGVSFLVTDNGNSFRLTADCQEGTLNGTVPSSAAEAELVNAACQVAYGAA